MSKPQIARHQFVLTYFENHPLEDQSKKIIGAMMNSYNKQKKPNDNMPDFSDLRDKMNQNRRFSLYE